ncbi:MAG: PadR family transcriptional regulator [Xanthomonadales bacterium]|nr:PadR family transcriptional regulator [Xanthomonadales bacterium]MCB1627733.1 PadR family transcriptional regulator [Xanthomonadales bacterium]MCB1635470.1 PadR family transcriptional regulator [Xanthomonadales bacterium]MCB1642882.1 PadR family transcriptional regulator [Xanthomonadales bacterium]
MGLAVIPGTLEMLALKAISLGPEHGFGVLQRIQACSGDVLQVEQGALYPALHRLEAQGWVEASWGISDNNRRAKYYAITAAGQQRLSSEASQWRGLVEATSRVLDSLAETGSMATGATR